MKVMLGEPDGVKTDFFTLGYLLDDHAKAFGAFGSGCRQRRR